MRTILRAAAAAAALLIVACTGTGGSRPSPAGTAPPTAPAGTAPPAVTGLRGLIAYSTQSGDIWVMHADGSGQTRLTRGPDQKSPAAWLPDGRIVYASFHSEAPLPTWYLMQADGTGIRSLPQLRGAADPIDWLATAG